MLGASLRPAREKEKQATLSYYSRPFTVDLQYILKTQQNSK